MKKLVGQVTPEEKNEIQTLFERRNGLNELAKILTADNSDLYEKRRRMYEANRLAARFFHTVLYSEAGAQGLQYLHDRGLTDATIRKFGLGYAPKSWDALRNYMHTQGFTQMA